MKSLRHKLKNRQSKPEIVGSSAIAAFVSWIAVAIQPALAWQPAPQPLTATSTDAVAGIRSKESQASATSERAEPQPLSDVQVASFQKVVPGKSTVDQVLKELGNPASRATSEKLTTLNYKIDPFERVEIILADDVVTSVIVYLEKPRRANEVAAELGLARFVPAMITDVDGRLLGQAYPERGILLSIVPGQAEGRPSVAQIVIEQIDADPFLYRAQYNRGYHYLAALEDLRYAQKLNPNDAESLALSGEILMHSGRYSEAAKDIDRAITQSDGQAEHRLLKAKLLAQQNKYAEAVAETNKALDAPGLADLTKVQAQNHLGYLLSVASIPNFKESIKNYTEAIKTATALAEGESREVQVAAKRASFDAHLGVADNIARGPWKRKQEVSLKWVGRAADIANELIEAGEFDESLLWVLQRKKLAVLAGSMSTEDPAPTVGELIRLSKKLIADCEDPLFRARVQFQTGRALINAAQLQHWRRKADLAVEYATIGTKLFNAATKQRDVTADHDYRMGRAYFLIGSVHSILRSDHEQAVTWFSKAELKLRGPLPELFAYEKNIHGDRFISMGVSFWQTGERKKAVELTKHGIDILEEAVKSGVIKPSALKIPYGNYGNMQKQLGKDDEAERYIERAARLQSPKPPTRR